MRTAKYHDYAVLKIFAFILLVILGLSIYFIFVKPSMDHKAGADAWVTVDPTCDADGYRYKVCEDCGEMFDRETIPPTGHQDFVTKKENEKYHTETVGGSYEKVVYCKDCGEEISRETVWVGGAHTPEVVETFENNVDPTCDDEGGYIRVLTCAVCKEVFLRETVVVDALGHEYEWTVVYDAETNSYSLHGVCGIDGSETSVTETNSEDFEVAKDETVASCCLTRYIVSCTYEGEELVVEYDVPTHNRHTVEYYYDQDNVYKPVPTYIVLPAPKVDPVYGEYYDIDEVPGIKPYNTGNSVWDENGFSYGVYKCYACENYQCPDCVNETEGHEHNGCTACADSGYRFIVRIYSAKYDTRLEDNNSNA